ncbi:translation initiation factor IF-2-like isoform X1 [Canis lupus familiaris]|uniref:translation initiation factor IF-2-like isoform X1 n=1 Tax=Canis lupus familiaris TaxID=9615 RepID=UPI0018F7DDC3|nr:translation initiation factor IF-2-like isoform X1 [Canis lupus familiaris]
MPAGCAQGRGQGRAAARSPKEGREGSERGQPEGERRGRRQPGGRSGRGTALGRGRHDRPPAAWRKGAGGPAGSRGESPAADIAVRGTAAPPWHASARVYVAPDVESPGGGARAPDARTHARTPEARVRPRPDPRAPAGPRALVCAREAALGARARPCSRFHMSPPWTLGRRRPGGFLCPPAVLSSRGAGTPAPALPYRSAPNCFISSCAEENMGLTLERVRIGDPTVLRHLRTTDWPVCYLQDLLFLRMSIFWSIGFQDKHIPANMIPGQAVLEFELATEKGLSPGHTHSFQWGVSHSWLC